MFLVLVLTIAIIIIIIKMLFNPSPGSWCPQPFHSCPEASTA